MNSDMHCSDLAPKIDAFITVGAQLMPEAIAHVRGCELCRQRCADAALNRLLLSHDVPPPRPGFVDEAIRNAIDQHAAQAKGRAQRVWIGAIAASIAACAVAVGVLVTANSNLWWDSTAQITLAPLQSKTVRLLIDSTEARESATITIELADNLELEGFRGDHVIEWETNLKEGKNLLALPLRLKDEDRSHFNVAFTDGSMRKQIRVKVAVDNAPKPPQVI